MLEQSQFFYSVCFSSKGCTMSTASGSVIISRMLDKPYNYDAITKYIREFCCQGEGNFLINYHMNVISLNVIASKQVDNLEELEDWLKFSP
jgi:hypothetical protein